VTQQEWLKESLSLLISLVSQGVMMTFVRWRRERQLIQTRIDLYHWHLHLSDETTQRYHSMSVTQLTPWTLSLVIQTSFQSHSMEMKMPLMKNSSSLSPRVEATIDVNVMIDWFEEKLSRDYLQRPFDYSSIHTHQTSFKIDGEKCSWCLSLLCKDRTDTEKGGERHVPVLHERAMVDDTECMHYIYRQDNGSKLLPRTTKHQQNRLRIY
jgi:hypothetical protein